MHGSLGSYFESNFALMHHHKWSLHEIDDLIPWEKEIYVSMLVKHLKEEERRHKEQQMRG